MPEDSDQTQPAANPPATSPPVPVPNIDFSGEPPDPLVEIRKGYGPGEIGRSREPTAPEEPGT